MSSIVCAGFEVLMMALFIYCLIYEIAGYGQRIYQLLLTAVYGYVLEVMTVLFFSEYSYSNRYNVRFFGVPVAIGFFWSIVIYLSDKATKRLRLPSWLRPFSAALIAVSADLLIDPVAIRLGLWSWHVSLDSNWFGVFFGNYYGWFFVVSLWLGLYQLLVQVIGQDVTREVLRVSAATIFSLLALPVLLYVSRRILGGLTPLLGSTPLIVVLVVIAVLTVWEIMEYRLVKKVA